MSLKFEIPERCLLAQAALYVDRGYIPIPDSIYLSAPEFLSSGPPTLTRALFANSLKARADLFEAFREVSEFVGLRDWQAKSGKPELSDVEINPTLWTHDQIDFSNSRLVAKNWPVVKFYGIAPAAVDPPEPAGRFPYDYQPGPEYDEGFIFSKITVSTSDLFRLFVRPTQDTTAIEERTRRAGRPPKYPWEEFFAEIVVIADLDSLPDTQAELVSQMADWCIQNWGEQPSESVLKEKTAAIFNHARKREKGR